MAGTSLILFFFFNSVMVVFLFYKLKTRDGSNLTTQFCSLFFILKTEFLVLSFCVLSFVEYCSLFFFLHQQKQKFVLYIPTVLCTMFIPGFV
jgi:hypothetical protein